MASKIVVVVIVVVGAVLLCGSWIVLDRPTSFEEAILNLKQQIWGMELVEEEIPITWLINHDLSGVSNVVKFTPELKLLENFWFADISMNPLSTVDGSAVNRHWFVEVLLDGMTSPIRIFNPETLQLVDNSPSLTLGYSLYKTNSIALSNNKLVVASTESDQLIYECPTVFFFDLTEKAPLDSVDFPDCQSEYELASLVTTDTGDVYFLYTTGIDIMTLRFDRYNVQTGDIERMRDMPASFEGVDMQGPRTAEHGGDIFVCDNSLSLDIGCAVYHPAGDTWEVVGSFKKDRYGYRLESIGGRLYAIMGQGQSVSIEIYNDAQKTWELFMDDIDVRYSIEWA